MKEYEGFVSLTKEEWQQKVNEVKNFPEDAPFNKGDVCFTNGHTYMSMKNNNRKCPIGATNSEWKMVFVDK